MSSTPYRVTDVMSHTVVAVGRDALFKEIVDTLEKWKVSAVPVLEGEGRVIGVVSEADLLAKEEYRDRDPSRIEQLNRIDDLAKAGGLTAEDLMSAPAVTVHPGATLAEAARIMARRRVKRLPVVDSVGKLEGIVSRSDLLKVFLRSDEEIADEVRHEVMSHLFLRQPEAVDVTVEQGVVTLSGEVVDTSVVPLAARLVRTIEGVVDVKCELTAPLRAHGEPPAMGPTS